MAFQGGNLAVVEDPEERRIIEPGRMYTPGYLFEEDNPLSEPVTEEPGLVPVNPFGLSPDQAPIFGDSYDAVEEVSCFLPQLHQIPFDDNNDREFTLGMGPMIGSELEDITDGITANLEGLLEDISYTVPVSASNVQILTPTSPAMLHPTTRIVRPSQMRPLSRPSGISETLRAYYRTQAARDISSPATQIVQPTQLLSSQNAVPAINLIPPTHPTSAISPTNMHITHPTLMHRLSSIPAVEAPRKQPPRPTVENVEDEEWQAPVAPMDRPFTPEGTQHPTEVLFAKEAAPPPESPPRHKSPETTSPPTPPPTLRRSTRKRAVPERYIDGAGH